MRLPTANVKLWALLAILLTGGGCWEEIHYVPKSDPIQIADVNAEDAPKEPPDAVDPPEIATPEIDETEIAQRQQPPGADDLFTSEGSPAIAAESTEPEVAAPEDVILPTPEGLAAMLESAGSENSGGAGGRRGDLALEPTPEERRFAWEAASKWSLAAAIYAKGLNASRYEPILEEAIDAAAKLDIELPPLPTTQQAADLEAAVIEALRGESAVALTHSFAERFGPAEAAVADLAIRTHLLLLTYSPRNDDTALQTEALQRAAEASGLPIETWEPLLKLLEDRAPFVEVRQAVFEMDNRVAKHLTGATDSAGDAGLTP